jgi:hypothetical protein
MKTQRLAMAGSALIGIGAVQLAGALYFCWAGGMDGVLSPVAAVTLVWPLAALLMFLGGRLRRVAV